MIKKVSFLNLLIIICVLSVLASLFFYFSSNKIEEEEFSHQDARAEELKDQNSDAINEAAKFSNHLRMIDSTDHYVGDLNAAVQVIVYTDFDCPFCADFSETTKKVTQYFGNKIALAVRHFPLSSHHNSVSAALASECAYDQGKFWEMHNLLFEANKKTGLNNEKYSELADSLGLDIVDFNKCFDSGKYKDKIYLQKAEGKTAGANGTPTVFVDNEILPGAVPFEDYRDRSGENKEGLKSIIERHLEQ